jgi:drug/metabolite transporter (DMT)-like permease
MIESPDMRAEKEATKYGILLAIIPCMLWGMAFPLIKLGYSAFSIAADDVGGQLVFAGIRFTLSGILAWIIGSVIYRKPLFPKRASIKSVLILALFQTFLQYVFFYIGLAHSTGVKSSIINATNVFFAFIVAALIFHQEKMSVRKWVGCAIGFLSVIIINLNGSTGFELSPFGEGLLLLSAIASAFSSAFIKKFTENELAFTLSSWQFFIGGIGLILVGKLIGRGTSGFTLSDISLSNGGIWIIFGLTFISAVAYSMWGVLLHRYEVSHVAIFGFFIPIFGVLFSAILLNEWSNISPVRIILALCLIIIGTLLCQIKSE